MFSKEDGEKQKRGQEKGNPLKQKDKGAKSKRNDKNLKSKKTVAAEKDQKIGWWSKILIEIKN